MKPIKRRRFISILEKDFSVRLKREGKGSHTLYCSPNGLAVIPRYEELSGMLAKKILKELDIGYDEFLRCLRK